MPFWNRFRNAARERHDATPAWNAASDDPAAWHGLTNAKLIDLLLERCIFYGRTQDLSRVTEIFALYKHAATRLNEDERVDICTSLISLFEDHDGDGHLGLMAFLVAEDAPAVISTAAMGLALLYPPQGSDPLTGAKFVLSSMRSKQDSPRQQGAVLSGLLLLGDKRLLPLLEEAWDALSDAARLQLTRAKSPFASEAAVEFWLRCLEKGCSESVQGAIVAALARMPLTADPELVCDVERVFPSWADRRNPLRVLRHSAFPEHLPRIRSRLEELAAREPRPDLIPQIYLAWQR